MSKNTRKISVLPASFGSYYYLPNLLARFILRCMLIQFSRLLYPFGAGSISIFVAVEVASA